jgi:hypothetical protein
MAERHVRVLQNGTLVAGESYVGLRPGELDASYRCNLVPGDYAITVSGNGMSGQATFTVGADSRVVTVILQ